jgi:hypothetical protein
MFSSPFFMPFKAAPNTIQIIPVCATVPPQLPKNSAHGKFTIMELVS